MRSILLSFESDWYEQLENNKTKFEYRKVLPKDDETKVFFYVSNPIKAITGIAIFGKPESLSSWIEKFGSRSPEVQRRIDEYLLDCKYAVPIKEFTPTNRISLSTLQDDVPGFIVPRMYYYIENSILENYLITNLHPLGKTIVNDFSTISDDEICI